MKMKWKSALLALFIGGVTLTACSDKGDVIDPEVTPIEEGDAYLSLDMVSGLDIFLTKADYEDGTKAEQAVKNAMWVLYDPVTMVSKYRFLLDASTDGAANFGGTDVSAEVAPSVKTFTAKARAIVKQEYKLLFVLNYTGEMATAAQVGNAYSHFEEAKETTVEVLMDNSFIAMSNAKGLVDVKESYFYPTAVEAEGGSKPLVQVDRMVAKVELAMSGNITYPNGGSWDAATTKWALDITNKKTYWVRRFTFVAPVVTGDAKNFTPRVMENDPSLPALFERKHVYAEDPNFDNISVERNSANPAQGIDDNFNYITTTAISNNFSSTAGVLYTLENTMAADEQYEDVTTRVLIQANYIPTGFITGASYYYYAGAAFTHAQMQAFVAGTTPWPTTPSGMELAVKDAIDNHGLNLAGGESINSFTTGAISFYKNGISYYSTLIRHFSEELSANDDVAHLNEMNFGRYGVVRNNVYKVTITSVTGPGQPTIPDPKGPDDKEKKYLSVDVQVLPWVVREQNTDL